MGYAGRRALSRRFAMGEKKRVAGVVDRIEAGMVVVVIRDPEDPGATREIYVPREKIKKVDLQEGDRVSVLV
jgi:transcription termination factor Rho